VVTLLLQTLAETLAAVRVPILFARDNMERLLAPRGPVDNLAAQSFFNGLAHTIDQTHGLLLVLFVERGLWNEFGGAINSFADHRLRQGVRVRDYGCVWDLELTPPTADQIDLATWTIPASQPGGLTAAFPSSPPTIAQIERSGDLRPRKRGRVPALA
jgi:hypothetical protein